MQLSRMGTVALASLTCWPRPKLQGWGWWRSRGYQLALPPWLRVSVCFMHLVTIHRAPSCASVGWPGQSLEPELPLGRLRSSVPATVLATQRRAIRSLFSSSSAASARFWGWVSLGSCQGGSCGEGCLPPCSSEPQKGRGGGFLQQGHSSGSAGGGSLPLLGGNCDSDLWELG